MPRDYLQPSADQLVLYPFRFRDPVSGKWVRSRYVAERHSVGASLADAMRSAAATLAGAILGGN
jgi:hypothetical protein